MARRLDRRERASRGWAILHRYQQDATMATTIILTSSAAIRAGIVVAAWPPKDSSIIPTSVLFAVSLILPFLWWMDTGEELSIAEDYGEFVRPRIPRRAKWIILGAVIGFASLVLTSAWPVAFAVVLMAIKLVEWAGSSTAHRSFEDAYRVAIESSSARTQAAAEILHDYYFEFRWGPLRLAETSIAAGAALVAAVGLVQASFAIASQWIAAVLLVVAIGGNEIAAERWRSARDDRLDALETSII